MSRRRSKQAKRNGGSRKAAAQTIPVATTFSPQQVKKYGEEEAKRANVLDIALCCCGAPLMILLGYYKTPSPIEQIGLHFPAIFMSLLIAAVGVRLWSYQEMIHTREIVVVRRMLRLRIAVAITVLTILLFPPLYLSPFPGHVSSIIVAVMPELGDHIAVVVGKVVSFVFSGVSGAIANIVFGIIGNFIYDSLKRRYKKRET